MTQKRTLCLMRHAEAANAQNGDDHSRVLTTWGQEQALRTGKALVSFGYAPELVICSAATRTKQTCDALISGGEFKNVPVDYEPSFYTGNARNYYDAIVSVDDDVTCVLIIGHNPAIHELALELSNRSDAAKEIAGTYPPATVTVLSFHGDWINISGSKRVVERIITSD